MKEEMVDVDLSLDKETADTLKKMTKAELFNRLIIMILRNRVQDETVRSLEINEERTADRIKGMEQNHKQKIAKVEAKLEKAEFYVEQARAMVEAVMEKWYHYDL